MERHHPQKIYSNKCEFRSAFNPMECRGESFTTGKDIEQTQKSDPQSNATAQMASETFLNEKEDWERRKEQINHSLRQKRGKTKKTVGRRIPSIAFVKSYRRKRAAESRTQYALNNLAAESISAVVSLETSVFCPFVSQSMVPKMSHIEAYSVCFKSCAYHEITHRERL